MTKPDKHVAFYIYGGGIRGLVPAYIMQTIEKRTGLHMADMVDIFTGPSSGAILNCALNIPDRDNPDRPRYKARHMTRFYERQGLRIFPRDAFRDFRAFIHDFNNRTMKIAQLNRLFRNGHYDPVPLGRALRALYGRAQLSDSLSSLIVSTYNIDGDQLVALEDAGETEEAPVHTLNNFIDEGGHAVWLKNIKLPGARNKHPVPEVDMYDAVMASTAAPTFFPCHHFTMHDAGTGWRQHITGIDGSIYDNPCTNYMGAIRQHLPEQTDLAMIVLGTGYYNRSYRQEDWDRYGSLGVVDPVNDLPLINILFHASESALLDSFTDELDKDLYVFNKSLLSAEPEITPAADIDDASPENIRNMKLFADAILEDNAADFDRVCDLLVRNYEQGAGKGTSSRRNSWLSMFTKR
jgi:predicted acylesterase/phospholipase RssA